MKASDLVSDLHARSYQILRHLNEACQVVTDREDWGPRIEPSSVKLSYALSQALLSFVTLC